MKATLMLESPINKRTRDAYRTAHCLRGKALSDLVRKIFLRPSSR